MMKNTKERERKQRIGNSNEFLDDRQKERERESELEAVLRLNYAKTSIPGHAGNSSL